MDLFWHRNYTANENEFDTTAKSGWIVDSLIHRPIAGISRLRAPKVLSINEIKQTHDARFVEAVRTGVDRSLASSGLSWNPGLWKSVWCSNSGAVSSALSALESGKPAGSLSSGLHHARRDHGSAFCTFNGLALSANAALAHGARRVLVLDLDAHCGGGTFSLLSRDERVYFVDISTSMLDSYTPNERAILQIVRDPSRYLRVLRAALSLIGDIGFDLVLYNAGMDPHEDCGVGGLLGISTEVIAERERIVFDWAAAHKIPVSFVLAGGYLGYKMTEDKLVNLHRLTIAEAASHAA